MRIHSNKSLLFRGDNGKEIIKNGEIKDLPDWVAKTDTFIAAKEEGSLFIISTKKEESDIENNKGKSKKNKNQSNDTESPNNQEDN